MNYIIDEKIQYSAVEQKNATSKARKDIVSISCRNGCIIVNKRISEKRGNTFGYKLKYEIVAYRDWKKCFKNEQIKKRDNVIIQWPPRNNPYLLYKYLRRLTHKQIKIIIFIHDIDSLRFANKRKSRWKEKKIFNCADKLVAHNQSMIEELIKKGIERDKLINLEIFDYLVPQYSQTKNNGFDKTVVIAGNLIKEKAGYLYSLPSGINFNLYGIGYEGKQENVHYFGSYDPEELPNVMQGNFGLVWDGNCVDSCSGESGVYLKYNNPHKTSLYLASGMPVITWNQAAIAKFITDNKCGFVVNSLNEIEVILSNMSEEEYNVLKSNAEMIGERIRSGYYTIKSILSINE